MFYSYGRMRTSVHLGHGEDMLPMALHCCSLILDLHLLLVRGLHYDFITFKI